MLGLHSILCDKPSFALNYGSDRIQFTQPWKDQKVANRDLATITYLDATGNVRARLDDSNRSIGWNLRMHAHIDYAYSMTSHSAQGTTNDRTLAHIDTGDTKVRALIDDTLAYVAGSRPRYDFQIFTDNAAELVRSLSRHHKNEMALTPEESLAHFAQYTPEVRKPAAVEQQADQSQSLAI